MPGRTRTTKKLAQRIDRDYFKRLYALPRSRRILSLALTAIGVLWLAWYAFAGNSSPYSAGPIRSSHASFSKNCATCHVSTAAFTKKVSNDACLACHDGPIHKAEQTFTPACSICHVEHTGAIDLTRTNDQDCTQCHANLRTRNGIINVAAHIRSFDAGHPEFSVLRPGNRDHGTIKFNHAVHLKKELRGPHGYVQLECADCHRPAGVDGKWRYGQAALSAAAAPQPRPHTRQSMSAYMAPVNYYEHCSGCHDLQFDKRFEEPVPHAKAEVVDAFVFERFTEYIRTHPEELHATNFDERIPTRPLQQLPRTPAEWVATRTWEAETLLWNKSCKECHALSFPSASSVPVVAKASITPRWFTNANFDHEAHQMLTCESCHSHARASTQTSDILLPGIATCQQCHRPSDKAAAQGSCFECHSYHDWTKEKPVKGKYSIHQLIAAVSSSAGVSTPE